MVLFQTTSPSSPTSAHPLPTAYAQINQSETEMTKQNEQKAQKDRFKYLITHGGIACLPVSLSVTHTETKK